MQCLLTTVVVVNFIQQDLPTEGPFPKAGAAGTDGQPGALGKGQRASTSILLFSSFWSYVMPLVGVYSSYRMAMCSADKVQAVGSPMSTGDALRLST